MTLKKTIFIMSSAFIGGGIVGYLITTQTSGRYNVINATCTVLNVAVENKMLTNGQILALGKLTKSKLGDSKTATYFTFDKKKLENAASASNCSQFIVGMNQ